MRAANQWIFFNPLECDVGDSGRTDLAIGVSQVGNRNLSRSGHHSLDVQQNGLKENPAIFLWVNSWIEGANESDESEW